MYALTRWGRVTYICVGKLIIICSDNGLSPGRHQAIIWTNFGTRLMGPSGTNFSEILIKIHTFSFTQMHLKMSSAKWRLFCLGLNELSWDLVQVIVYPPVPHYSTLCWLVSNTAIGKVKFDPNTKFVLVSISQNVVCKILAISSRGFRSWVYSLGFFGVIYLFTTVNQIR